jgi:hypothetical protein
MLAYSSTRQVMLCVRLKKRFKADVASKQHSNQVPPYYPVGQKHVFDYVVPYAVAIEHAIVCTGCSSVSRCVVVLTADPAIAYHHITTASSIHTACYSKVVPPLSLMLIMLLLLLLLSQL